MVEETIRVIRETESQADQIVKHAQDQYNKLLEEARKEADKIRTEQLQSAKQKAEQEMEAAKIPRRWRNGRSQYSDRAGDQSVERKRAEKRSGGG